MSPEQELKEEEKKEKSIKTPIKTPKKSGKKGIFLVVVLVILVLGCGFAAFYFYGELLKLRENPQQIAQEIAQAEIKSTINKVGKLILLPSDEEPTVATVVKPEELKGQTFFKNASVGDKILIYTSAKKAILYNPTLDKIIEVAPLNLGDIAQ